jgi:hypothetical protein
MSFKRLNVHENFVRELRKLKKIPSYRNMTIEEMTAYIKPIPLLARKETIEKRMKKILESLHKQVRFE